MARLYLVAVADTLPKELMPSHGISWKAVALAMNNERLPLDYQRRWTNLRAKVCDKQSHLDLALQDMSTDI
jgi:hypothetical protein